MVLDNIRSEKNPRQLPKASEFCQVTFLNFTLGFFICGGLGEGRLSDFYQPKQRDEIGCLDC